MLIAVILRKISEKVYNKINPYESLVLRKQFLGGPLIIHFFFNVQYLQMWNQINSGHFDINIERFGEEKKLSFLEDTCCKFFQHENVKFAEQRQGIFLLYFWS